MTPHRVRALLLGMIFGGTLGGLGFSSWDAVHGAFVFDDARLAVTVGLSIALVASVWMGFVRDEAIELVPKLARGTVLGAALFGAGWAITGACPALAFVQLGEGKLGALVTILGIVLGNFLWARFGESAHGEGGSLWGTGRHVTHITKDATRA